MSELEFWINRSLTFATALVKILEGIEDNDICYILDMDEKNSKHIASIRAEARKLIKDFDQINKNNTN